MWFLSSNAVGSMTNLWTYSLEFRHESPGDGIEFRMGLVLP